MVTLDSNDDIETDAVRAVGFAMRDIVLDMEKVVKEIEEGKTEV